MGVFEQDVEVLRRVRLELGWTVPNKGLAYSDRFASGGGDTVKGDLTVVQFLLPGFCGGVGVTASQVTEQVFSMVLAPDDCGVGIALIEHGA